MTQTLHDLYETKRATALHERLMRANRALLIERKAARLLLEAMSQEDLNKVTAIVQKLNSVKSPQLPKLSAAIEQAQAELNKYTAGGPIAKAWSKMKELVGVDNPIVKITTFANALERGFSQIPQILKNNGIDLKNADLNKSLVTMMSGDKNARADANTLGSSDTKQAGPEKPVGSGGLFSSQNEADKPNANVENKLKNVVNQLQKALSPGGIFGAFKKVPYISGQELAQELIQAPLNVFSQVAKRIQSGPKAADIAPDMQRLIGGHGEAETKGTGGGQEPAKQTNQPQQTAPSVSPTATTPTTPPGKATAKPQGGGAPSDNKKAVFQRLKDANVFHKVGLNDASADAFLSALDDIGALKEPG